MKPQTSLRQRTLTLTNEATPFGCCNFFDACDDGLMTLYYAGQLPLLDWMGFNVTDVCLRSMEYLTYVRPAQSQGSDTPGYICDPCHDPYGVEWGSCKLQLEDFGRYGRLGPTRELMKPKFYCKTRPIVRLDGTPVTSEREWDMKFVSDQVINDVSVAVVNGDAGTCGQFDGLEHIVTDGYSCGMLDSIVIDWNGNPMTGGNGVTWNGAAVANTFNIVDVLIAIFNRFVQRISWAPMLKAQRRQVGDMILVMPNDLIDCLLNFYTCWSVCTDNVFSSYESRTFRDSLNGGAFGYGQITLKGFTIPILGYDWGLLKGPKTGDMYFLTGAVGGQRIWEGEHLDGNMALKELGEQNMGYWTTDGGRMLWKIDTENECRTVKGWIHPRMWCAAPFLQARFTDVQCETPGGFLSPDPADTSWFPPTSFSQAACPDGNPGVHE
jgi:hypothetical protein